MVASPDVPRPSVYYRADHDPADAHYVPLGAIERIEKVSV